MVTPRENMQWSDHEKTCKEQCQEQADEEDHARPGWTTSIHGLDSPWKSQSESQKTQMNGKTTSMAWSTLGLRTANEQNRTHRPRAHHEAHQSVLWWDSNRNIFSSRRNVSADCNSFRSVGNLFHARGAAPHKALSSIRRRVCSRILHGNGKIPRDYRGKTAAMVIRTK